MKILVGLLLTVVLLVNLSLALGVLRVYFRKN